MITLRDAVRRLQDKYALKRPDNPKDIVRSFEHVLDSKFSGKKYRDLIVKIKVKKKNRLVVHVVHPAVIQEMEGFREEMIKAVNDDLGERYLLNIEFRVVPS